MKVKWKHIIARMIPTATLVAAVVIAISGHGTGVKWG
jgi:hypothetical protein